MKKVELTTVILSCFLFLNPLLAKEKENKVTNMESYLVEEVYKVVRMKYNGTWGASFYINANIASDDAVAGGEAEGDQPQFQMADDFTFDATVSSSEQMWYRYMMGIERCNYVLFSKDPLSENANKVIAEAKFLRAYFYFNLVRIFGEVPVFVEGCLPVLQKYGRSSITEVYAFIIDDLLAASENLPLKTELQEENKFRATKGAAQSLLGKVYLYNEDWENALSTLQLVINSSQYALESNFEDIFKESNEHGIESIFEKEYNSNYEWDWSSNDNHSNIDIQLMGIHRITDSDVFEVGWGFGPVTADLVSAFDAAGDSERKNATIISSTTLDAQGVGYEVGHDFTGYWNVKYIPRIEYANPSFDWAFGQNEIVLRYADVLLMAAEASAQLGNEAEALSYLNMIRERAGLTNANSFGTQLLRDIYSERRLELALESNRFFDLQRWGMLDEVMSPLGFNVSTNGLWPIPQEVIDFNPSMTQNPSYEHVNVDYTGNTMIKNIYSPTGSVFSVFPQLRKKNRNIQSMQEYQYNICYSDSVLTGIFSYVNDARGLVLENSVEGYNKHSEGFNELFKTEFDYKSNGDINSSTAYTYDVDLEDWVVHDDWNPVYEYLPSGHLLKATYYLEYNGVEMRYKEDFVWDENMLDYEIFTYLLDNETDQWDLIDVGKYENKIQGDYLVETLYSIKNLEDEYRGYTKSTNYYAEDNSYVEYSTFQSSDGATFELSSRYKEEFVYDIFGRAISKTYYDFNIELNTYDLPNKKIIIDRDYGANTELVKEYVFNTEIKEFIQNEVAQLYKYNEWYSVDIEPRTGVQNGENVIYPNPSNGNIQFNLSDPINSVEVYALDGKKLITEKGDLKNLNFSNLETGLYVVIIKGNNFELKERMVITK